MNIGKLPKVGARNLKTALAILLSILVLKVLHFESPFYACIAAVICMSDSYENSVKMGKNRMIGTIIGGLFGTLATIILSKYNVFWLKTLLIFVFIIAVIYICTLLKKPGSVSIACIVLLANLLLDRNYSNYIYTLSRIVETFIGIIIAVAINAYIFPPKKKEAA
ncbi:MAG: FUSC family protein [Sarcina sp.]